MDVLLGSAYQGEHGGGTTYSARAAKALGLPRIGSGYRRQFTLGQTVAALSTVGMAGAPHHHARDLVYEHVPAIVDRYQPQFVLVADCRDCGPVVAWGDDEDLVAVAAAHRSRATVLHIVNVPEAVAAIEQCRAKVAAS